jgi:hypothetical protein
MTTEILEKLKMKCVFVPEWECPIETPEIPLEVCKICLEARKIQSKQIKIKRQIKSAEILPDHIVSDIEVSDAEVPHIVAGPP